MKGTTKMVKVQRVNNRFATRKVDAQDVNMGNIIEVPEWMTKGDRLKLLQREGYVVVEDVGNEPAPVAADLNNDGRVDEKDLSEMMKEFNKARAEAKAQAPKPAVKKVAVKKANIKK